jgi:hypothetical protein
MAREPQQRMDTLLDNGIGSEFGTPAPGFGRGQACKFGLGVARWRVGLQVHDQALALWINVNAAAGRFHYLQQSAQ